VGGFLKNARVFELKKKFPHPYKKSGYATGGRHL